VTLNSSAAEKIVEDILSSNIEILSAGVIDRSGNIIANKSSESFGKRFEQVRNLEHNRYSGTLAIAALGVATEVEDAFGKPQAIITIYRDCKLMLLPMPLYDILIGLALELSANVENNNNNNTFAKEMERLVARTLEP
jgi:hypothetical protein